MANVVGVRLRGVDAVVERVQFTDDVAVFSFRVLAPGLAEGVEMDVLPGGWGAFDRPTDLDRHDVLDVTVPISGSRTIVGAVNKIRHHFAGAD